MDQDKTVDIGTLIPDDHNFNRGTEEGARLMQKSFEQFGAGRSVLVDKDNRIIAGNKSTKAAAESGIKRVRIIETDGTELIAVKRTDITLDSKEGRELALADNATAQINLSWDEAELKIIDENIDIGIADWGVDFLFEKRKGWGKAKDHKCPVCDMREKIEIHEHVGYKTISMYKKSEEGIPFDVIKKDSSYIDIFSNSATNLIRGLIGLKVKNDWCLVTTPKRRHKEENFSDNVCKKISLDLGIKYYPDIVIAKTKQRVNPIFELQGQIEENNVIIYDDIITTGSTILATAKLFNSKNTLLIVGINNN